MKHYIILKSINLGYVGIDSAVSFDVGEQRQGKKKKKVKKPFHYIIANKRSENESKI